MTIKVYSIFDSKSKSFQRPFYMLNNYTAIRAFSDLVNTDGQMESRHPQDFSLYEIGTFDDQTAETISANPIILLKTGTEMKMLPELPKEQLTIA